MSKAEWIVVTYSWIIKIQLEKLHHIVLVRSKGRQATTRPKFKGQPGKSMETKIERESLVAQSPLCDLLNTKVRN